MLKNILPLFALCCIALKPTAAHATDPDWWIEFDERQPELFDYNLFKLTEEQSVTFENDEDAACMKEASRWHRMDTVDNAELICSETQFARIETRLDVSYNALLAALPPYRDGVLQREQEKWLNTRWDTCFKDPEVIKYHHSMAHRLSVNRCKIKELARRTGWIEQYHGYADRHDKN
jgi:uncharacterized protein YecT (DUF1311 family)